MQSLSVIFVISVGLLLSSF